MEELIKCQICFENYESNITDVKHPIIFNCGHGLCNQCNEELLQYNSIECPFCKTVSIDRVKNIQLMHVIDEYTNVRSEIANLRETNETIRELGINDQLIIINLRKENDKISERLERVRSNHREELLHWNDKNSDLNNRLESTENELAQLKSKLN